MDPKLTTDERKMREEMLQHDFPFDEKAWVSMEALLEHDKQKPLAGPPAKGIETLPGPGRNWTLILVLLFSFSLGASTFIWWNSKSDGLRSGASSGTTTMNSNSLVVPKESTEVNSSLGRSALPVIEKEALVNSKFEAVSQPESDINRQSFGYRASSKHARTNNVLKAPTAYDVESSTQLAESPLKATIPPTQILGSNDFTQTLNAIDPMPGSKATDEATLKLLDETLLPFPALLEIPYLSKPPQLDSLIRPAKMLPVSIRRKERGWIFGVNANTVDNNPIRLSVLPHLGYFLSYRFRPKTILQAEIMAKYVTGYHLSASFIDIIPGGASEVILHTNNLIFLEIPLVVKRQYKPEQSWLLGIKPSGNLKVFSGGLTSYSNDAADRFYTNQDGMRYFDLGLVLGWEWRYHKNWALDIRYNQGLFDLTFDQFYRDNSTHLNSDLQVSLRYSLSNKTRRHAPKTLFPTPAGR